MHDGVGVEPGCGLLTITCSYNLRAGTCGNDTGFKRNYRRVAIPDARFGDGFNDPAQVPTDRVP